jgi:hypothetical protein
MKSTKPGHPNSEKRMRRRKREKREGQGPAADADGGWRSLFKAVLLPLVVAALALGGLYVLRPEQRRSAGDKETTPAGPRADPPTPERPRATETQPEATGFERLLGKWARQDGDKFLEFKTVDAAGQLRAAYFNPSPIHVSKATAARDGTATKVFVELQDVNYPGCTYDLTYDPQTDQLMGVYFQAAIQQSYPVVFERGQ